MSKLLDVLVEKGHVTRDQIQDAKIKQVGAKKSISELLVDMDFIQEEDLINVASEVFGLPVCVLAKETIDPEVLKKFPYEKAKRYGVFPVRIEDGKLLLATCDAQDFVALEDIGAICGMGTKPILAKKSDITKHIEKYYLLDDVTYDLIKNMTEDIKIEVVQQEKENESFADEYFSGEESPIVRLCNLIVSDAVKARASDIHIEPYEKVVEVRYRVDGYLKNIMKIPKRLHAPLSVRIKILTELDIAETRKPQDGRSSILIEGRKVDLRVSTVPTFYGEKIVIRLLDQKKAQIDLDTMGFEKKDLEFFKSVILRPQGMILITGPTGSGKTSTLYAALNELKNETKNIVTIEDPVEYLLQGINQIQVNPAKNVDFATGLKSILRQDPNVILVGEIRDRDTADIAFRASLTGHLVFSTLHTNNALATVVRLYDIGLEPYLIGSSVILIVAQRLIRLVCPKCREDREPDEKAQEKFGAFIQKYKIKKLCRGKGCEHCGYTGFLGRTAIFEILEITEKIKEMISEKAPESDIWKEARNNGFMTLAEAGAQKVISGITTIEEIERVSELPHEEAMKREAEEKEVVKVDPEADKIAQQLRQELNKKFSILIVDDEPDIREILGMRLKVAGYNILEAEDGAEGVRMAHQEKPDLIIMDIMMPVMDGIAATKKIRDDLETAAIPILMLTAKTTKEDELEGLDAGADDYLGKPFDDEKLLARIKMLLRRR
ncbi:MAG: type II/IV secretion system protein [Candidatus Aceula lacicola]|nr:type II/IV secretion system protein [Candidatus Aceula lacicola]